MAFDINTFKQQGLKYGGARPSLFLVEFAPPAGILSGTTGTGSTADGLVSVSSNALSRLTCKAASLPESTVAPIEVSYFGRRIKVAGDRSFQDWPVAVINDENFVMRAMLEAWSNAINRLRANIRDTLFDQEGYKADITVRQFSKTGQEIRSYSMEGAWPIQVGKIDLDWDQGNAIEYFQVTFAYDDWVPLTELNTDGAVQYASTIDNTNSAPSA
jgi:hypothetical protein